MKEKTTPTTNKQPSRKIKIIANTITVLMTLLIILFIYFGIKKGIFSSDESLVNYMKQFGAIAPLLFILIQIIQVIFPVIPGGASCLAGVLAFGPIPGFIYNYIGLCIGSIIVFFLSRNYGMKLIEKLFCQETIDKYLKYIKTKKFDKIFFWGILLPGAPDDLLCYMSGITTMSFKTFLWIILLGKPLTLVFYSAGLDIFQLIFS